MRQKTEFTIRDKNIRCFVITVLYGIDENSGFFVEIQIFQERKDFFHRKFIDFTICGHYNCNNDISIEIYLK